VLNISIEPWSSQETTKRQIMYELYFDLLGCNAVRFGGRVPTFRKKVLSVSSVLNAIAVLFVANYAPTFYRLDGIVSQL